MDNLKVGDRVVVVKETASGTQVGTQGVVVRFHLDTGWPVVSYNEDETLLEVCPASHYFKKGSFSHDPLTFKVPPSVNELLTWLGIDPNSQDCEKLTKQMFFGVFDPSPNGDYTAKCTRKGGAYYTDPIASIKGKAND